MVNPTYEVGDVMRDISKRKDKNGRKLNGQKLGFA